VLTWFRLSRAVKYLNLTFSTPEENLACDEALLDGCEEGRVPELLRFWEPRQYFVVIGYSNRFEQEVKAKICQEQGIPTLRRCSGGGAVLQGPGCLNYSLILLVDSYPALQTLAGTNQFVMERIRAALETLLACSSRREEALSSKCETQNPKPELAVRGHTDLALGGLKFSGNAQRRKRRCLMFHGTFLLQFEIARVEQCLRMPARQPGYRQNRPHRDFLTNIRLSGDALKEALKHSWQATEILRYVPSDKIEQLVREKYSATAWNLRF